MFFHPYNQVADLSPLHFRKQSPRWYQKGSKYWFLRLALCLFVSELFNLVQGILGFVCLVIVYLVPWDENHHFSPPFGMIGGTGGHFFHPHLSQANPRENRWICSLFLLEVSW